MTQANETFLFILASDEFFAACKDECFGYVPDAEYYDRMLAYSAGGEL